MLNGSRGAPRDIVFLNAGVSLLVAGVVPDIAQGISRAATALDSGAAAAVLGRLDRTVEQTTGGRRNGDDLDVAEGGRCQSSRTMRGDPSLGRSRDGRATPSSAWNATPCAARTARRFVMH